MARPKGPAPIQIDIAELKRLARTGATQREIARKLGISESTLERRLRQTKYRTAFEAGQAELDISLRSAMVRLGLGLDGQGEAVNPPNAQILIFLAENRLGMSRATRFVDQEGKDRSIVDASPIDLITARIAGVIERKRESGGAAGS